MLKVLRIILSTLIIAIAIYGLVTGNDDAEPFMMFLLGVVFIMYGIPELQQRKKIGIFYVLVAAFMFFVILKTLFR